jgi:hypothetical protein
MVFFEQYFCDLLIWKMLLGEPKQYWFFKRLMSSSENFFKAAEPEEMEKVLFGIY